MINEEEFDRLARAHRREILAHTYRMLGSVSEAEDATQDALLRAWRSISTLEEKKNFRAWLYKIATHCSLDLAEKQKQRVLTSGGPADPGAPPRAPDREIDWIEPIPDAMIDPDPESRYLRHERIELAFLAALQRLPPRQRATLLLSEVIGFSAAEIAELLETSTASVNSALQRARETLGKNAAPPPIADDRTQSLLERYLRAWQTFDPTNLVSLLREDAVLTMPPSPTWILGRENMVAFWKTLLHPVAAHLRIEPARANGSPAFLMFVESQAIALQVIEVDGDLISAVHSFTEPEMLRRF
jgi:RNA polymerase sigma-70 factor, ECF subfamily